MLCEKIKNKREYWTTNMKDKFQSDTSNRHYVSYERKIVEEIEKDTKKIKKNKVLFASTSK